MPSAIAYTRVSRGGPRENSSGLDAQRHQIEKFASDRGFDILKVYSEICAYRGKINKVTRPALFSAMSYSMRNNTYIFVASFDRITQAPATVQNRAKYKSLKFISAKPDESNDSSLPVIDIIQRNRREKISSSTKSALAALQALGVKLGNVKNLEVVRGRGSETNKQLAKQRLSEFEILLAEARSLGARTDKEVAAKFNELGHLPARGGQWTAENIASFRGKLRASKIGGGPSSKGVVHKPRPLADSNRQLTPDGVERVKKAMATEGWKPGTTGKLMAELGFNRFDTTMSLKGRSPIKKEHLDALEAWIAKKEATV